MIGGYWQNGPIPDHTRMMRFIQDPHNYGSVMVPDRPLHLCSPPVSFLAVVAGRTSPSLSPIFNSSWVFRT
ncbi:hypothetical protein LWI29_006057 [Acer saccharum]|uniref:Uncharacterized protein n=1 Tax=Acer saccharum TaxID=4024 RepID=A0AA39RYG1_ACESA|nr:hypothetical protein LWI29_006057 [Acer saccharum]